MLKYLVFFMFFLKQQIIALNPFFLTLYVNKHEELGWIFVAHQMHLGDPLHLSTATSGHPPAWARHVHSWRITSCWRIGSNPLEQ